MTAVPDLFSVDGLVVVITGGATGIGLMMAEAFVRNGARAYIVARNLDRCRETAEALNARYAAPSFSGEAISLGGVDVASEKSCKEVAAVLKEREGRVDCLINNAGTNWGEALNSYPGKAFDKVFGVNVKGVFLLTRELLPLLEASASPEKRARVINIGSIDGVRVPALETYAYSASKAAVHQLTRVLAYQLCSRNINVNAIAPGPFESLMMKVTLERARDTIESSVPMQRLGQPDDMASAAIYFASPASAYVTGTILPVDGGILISAKL